MGRFEDLEINAFVEIGAELYDKIAVSAEELVYESYRAVNRAAALPIDIELIAHHLGLDIQNENLNLERGKTFSKILAVTTSTNDGVRIAVDTSVSYKTRRYALANGVGRYLLNESQNMLKNTYAIPLIPQNLEEIAADSIALFLMMPITLFKDEFLQYLTTCTEHPLNVDNWMVHLSDMCQIPAFNIAIGYQHMKQVLCHQRQKEFEQHEYDITKMPEDKYEMIFS